MLTALFLILAYGFAGFTAEPTPTISCTVGGHGPYDLTIKQCQKLTSRQSVANCHLSNKDETVEFMGSLVSHNGGSTELRGSCGAKFDKKSNECRAMPCQ